MVFEIVIGFVLGACPAYLLGFERGIRFKHTGEALPALSPIPLVSFGRKEKRKPKSISDEELFNREQKRAPADPA